MVADINGDPMESSFRRLAEARKTLKFRRFLRIEFRKDPYIYCSAIQYLRYARLLVGDAPAVSCQEVYGYLGVFDTQALLVLDTLGFC